MTNDTKIGFILLIPKLRTLAISYFRWYLRNRILEADERSEPTKVEK